LFILWIYNLLPFPPCICHRISITFRKMDEAKRPVGFVPEPDLQGIQPLSYELDKTRKLNSPKSEPYVKRRPYGKEGQVEGRRYPEDGSQSESRYSSRNRWPAANQWRTKGNMGRADG